MFCHVSNTNLIQREMQDVIIMYKESRKQITTSKFEINIYFHLYFKIDLEFNCPVVLQSVLFRNVNHMVISRHPMILLYKIYSISPNNVICNAEIASLECHGVLFLVFV